jgi:hypothetical protein
MQEGGNITPAARGGGNSGMQMGCSAALQLAMRRAGGQQNARHIDT